MAYPLSFFLQALAQFLVVGMEFVGIVFLFRRFGGIQGWTLPEIALLYGMVHVGFTTADACVTGFDQFGSMLKRGDFDRLLLRPRSTALQLAGQEFTLRRAGRFFQGAVVLAWALAHAPVSWDPARLGLLLFALAGTACTFFALFVLQATLAFWTVESLEVMNTMTYGGVEASQYPITIYRDGFRRFFTWVVPLAFMNYMPACTLLDRTNGLGLPPGLGWASPLVGFLFLALSLRVWHFGQGRYTSAGG